ncbi:MAG TPA: hypothetical protein VF670_05270 [Duganella sp.]|jgi:hypothetical protein
MKTWARVAARVAVVAVLVLVFMAYLQPGFVVDLANRFYMCF